MWLLSLCALFVVQVVHAAPRTKRQAGCQAFDLEPIETWLSGRNAKLKLSAVRSSPTTYYREFSVTLPRGVVINFWQASKVRGVPGTTTAVYRISPWKMPDDGFFEIGYTWIGLPDKTFYSLKINGRECLGNVASTNPPPVEPEKPVTKAKPKPPVKPPVPKEPIDKKPNPNKPNTCETKYDYAEVLHKSLLFYEAQRSGKLPDNNRIKWRHDSAVSDGSDVGKDLSGGYYDAGDFVKFGLPMASSITLLAWGMILFKDGYVQSKEYENGLAAIKWGTDYFLKCHTGPNEFYGQVGNGETDHSTWGRDTDLTSDRPSYVLNVNKPGSEVAGETAAALAAASIVFKSSDPAYSEKLLLHAKQLWNFGDKYRGKYSDSIPDANIYYKSWSGYKDELAWGAAWIAKATGGDKHYISRAEEFATLLEPVTELSWDNKMRGVQIMLADLTKEPKYEKEVKKFCDYLISDNQQRTPDGLVFIQRWGSNSHAANLAFACLAASRLIDGLDYSKFARKQIGLMLGDTGRSYVVGFGKKFPLQPYHSGASCPKGPAPCGWDRLSFDGPNPNILYGALVGGPDKDGSYEDKRSDFVKNDVTLNYNAGFQSAVAGLLTLKGEGRCD